MGLITQEVEVTLVSHMIKYYQDLGYEVPRQINKYNNLVVPRGTKIKIDVYDLPRGSDIYVKVKCDNCGISKTTKWKHYNNRFKDKKYYCKECAVKLYSTERRKQIKLKKGYSFENWCKENNRQDILDRWDYELNGCLPSEITFNTVQKYYFRCPINAHKSELKNVSNFTLGHTKTMDCKGCSSFAQWGIDNICKDFLEKYWDYGKNDKLDINPWVIQKSTAKPKVYIKCQEKDYHESYKTSCAEFIRGNRCPYCSHFQGKVHPLDSLGKLLEDKGLLHLWSDKNKGLSPYKLVPYNREKVWWKCSNGIHMDYFRTVSTSTQSNYRCPRCQYSKGEERIEQYLTSNKINHFPQKKFVELRGQNGGWLSYDFYLPEYNLLIEYQGEQHEMYIDGFHKTEKDFEKQLEHDRRKREYARRNNINLLEIWYWDFYKIEEILDSCIKN